MLKRILSIILLLWAALPALADGAIARIDIVVPANNSNYADIAGGIKHALAQKLPSLPVTIASNDTYATGTDSQNVLVIAIGDASLPWLFANAERFHFALAFLVNSKIFNERERNNSKISALYRDQPLGRQLQLAKLIVPNLQRAAIIHSADIALTNIEQLQREANIQIIDTAFDNTTDWAKTLAQLMRENDVLLGIEDPQIYNSENIRSILLTTYRHGKVLIGPSRPFVNAGSLASCYTASDQYLQQLLAMITTIAQEHRLPRPQFPKAYRVAVNSQVAASLGFKIPDENALTVLLQQRLGDCADGC